MLFGIMWKLCAPFLKFRSCAASSGDFEFMKNVVVGELSKCKIWTLELRNCGFSKLWNFETLKLWNLGILKPLKRWNFETLTLLIILDTFNI